MPKTTHTEAAEHHEKAAKSHRTAAEHHEKGDNATASKHSDEAHGHSTKATLRPAQLIPRAKARNRLKRGGGVRAPFRKPIETSGAIKEPRPWQAATRLADGEHGDERAIRRRVLFHQEVKQTNVTTPSCLNRTLQPRG